MNYSFYVIVCIAAAVILLLLIFLVWVPMWRVSRGAAPYAEGNYSQPIPVSPGGRLGYLCDVMNLMAGELNTLEETQRKFISNVSHDFRSPLTSIKGYAEAMVDGTIPPEMQEKYLQVIISETERLETLTESILELNKYNDQGMYLNLSTFDLNDKIRQALLTFEGRAQEKNLSFVLHLTDQPLYVRADSGQIDQVLHNLLDNAVKFSPEDAEITVETTAKNGKVFTSVKDHGIGIPRENQNKIWDRFYKSDLSRGKDKTGTGLGLAIVKEILTAHHENINVISTEGVGTEFVFSLTQDNER